MKPLSSIILILFAVCSKFIHLFALNINQIPKSQKQLNDQSLKHYGLLIGSAFTGILASQSILAIKPVLAVSGAIKASTSQQSKDAVSIVKKCLDGMINIENAFQKSDYDEIGRILSGSEYQDFEKAATVLVRSPNSNYDIKNHELNYILDWSSNYHHGRLLSIAIIMLSSLKLIDTDAISIADEKSFKRSLYLTKDAFTDIYNVINPYQQ